MIKPKIIFLLGPTAVGKTQASLKLARKINAEIISCDSMQLYKGMDIISSKPSHAARKRIPHHLLDIVSPQKEYSAAAYREAALKAIKKILKKKKIPLFVGGTGLYASTVVDGVFTGPGADERIRKRLYKQAKTKTPLYLYKRLERVDAEAAGKIHPNDLKRIVRALEVWITTKKPISAWQKQRHGITHDYDVSMYCLSRPRGELYGRIDKRVDQMFKQGMVKEVKRLLKKKISRTALLAIGIGEIKAYLDGKESLAEAKELIKRHTRRYAKRQLTWFRKDKRIKWVDAGENSAALKQILGCDN